MRKAKSPSREGDSPFTAYCYVADAVSGILHAMLLGKCGEAYNVADMDGAISLREITENIAESVGRKVVFDLPDEQEAAGFSKVFQGVRRRDGH